MRLLILILPLMVLWLALESGPLIVESAHVPGKSARVEWKGRSGTESQGSRREHLGDTGRLMQRASTWALLEGVEPGKPIPRKWAGSPELVEYVWRKLNPVLLAGLSAEEEIELRSFIGNLTGPGAADQPWVCWAPGVSLAKVAAYHEAENLTGFNRSGVSLFANQFLAAGKWDRTATDGFANGAQGLPLTLTWSIVPDGTGAPTLNGPGIKPSDMRAWLSSIYGGSAAGVASEQPWFPILEAAFDEMAETCGVVFVYEPNDDGQSLSFAPIGELGVRGDIRLAAREIDGDSGTLAFAFAPDRGDLILDSSDAILETVSSASLRLHNTLTHELGHALGLDHVCPLSQTKLMEPILTLFFRGPQFDDYHALQRLYGDVLEHHSADRNNDSLPRATPLTLIPGGELDLPRLSIDDNDDLDYFRVELQKGQKLSVTLTPGEGSYLEGGVIGDNCSGGTLFDSGSLQNLRLEIFNSDGSVLLASSFSGGLGEGEQITEYEVMEDGDHVVRVNGGSADAAQLYRMQLGLIDRPPAPRLVQLSSSVIEESGSVKNGRLDPGETVRVRVLLKNEGVLETANLVANVTVPAHATLFSTTFGMNSLEAGLTSYLDLVFGATGDCGDQIDPGVSIDFGGEEPLVVNSGHTLGLSETVVSFDLDFDDSSSFPSAWTTSTTGAGIAWKTSTARSDSPLRAIFADNVNAVGEARLESPTVVPGSEGGNLTFRHFYRNEANFDGAVLEASRDGGAWFDLPESAAEVLSGGYNATIKLGYNSPIAGRRAWSGSSGDFLTTSIQLPADWAGESIRFRWILAHDSSTSLEGWYLDNLRFSATSTQCEEHLPFLSLSSTGSKLSENSPERQVNLMVSSDLPLLKAVPFLLVPSGTAGRADYSGALAGTLPAGQSSVELPITATVDDLDEGGETLLVSLSNEEPGYVPRSSDEVAISIADSSEVSEWLALYFSSPVPLTGDFDGDGVSELGEYLLGTDPTSRTSLKPLIIEPESGGYLIPVGALPARPDASLGVEYSTDLSGWTAGGFSIVSDGVRLESEAGEGYFRWVFSLDE
ncbi:matrixin family metalloprotease [Verrucomicrobiaceae bacterium 227]